MTYFIDRFGHPSIYDIDFVTIPHEVPGAGASLTQIHSITYSVRDGRARECADFYAAVLGLEEVVADGPFAPGAATTVVRTADESVRPSCSPSRWPSGCRQRQPMHRSSRRST